MQTRILITGATGFVGSHILETLEREHDYYLVVACRNPEKLPPSFSGEVLVGDLRESGYREKIVADIDIICHAAAWTSLWSHKTQSKENFLVPSINLIKAAKKAGVKRFIFPSSTSVAAPDYSNNAGNDGIPRKFWPHLCNVITIENELKKIADDSFNSIILRLGIFTGRRYGIGILPILLPRLKTHLVPWVAGGNTRLPLLDGRDIGQAFLKAINYNTQTPYDRFNIVGTEQPTVKELIGFIHDEYGYPQPHFSVPFSLAYAFAWLMEKLDPFVVWEPLVTRSIIHLLENTGADNGTAEKLLGYRPEYAWQDSVKVQIEQLHCYQTTPMSMAKKEA